MSKELLHVCLVAPHPKEDGKKNFSYGGIVNWTNIVCKHATKHKEVKISVIDTTLRCRFFCKFKVSRVTFLGLQFILNIVQLLNMLSVRSVNTIHLTTSGRLSLIRDLAIITLAKLFKLPVIYHIHFGRIPEIANLNGREWRLLRYLISKSHTVIAIDNATRNTLVKHLPDSNVVLIPNCIDLSELPLVIPSCFIDKVVLFAGWVITTKGVTELVDAWAQLQPVGWKLQIIGPVDLTYKEALINQFSPVGIQFFGEMSHEQTIKLMASCDLFVLPSYSEGFPYAVLEAMSLSKAIVATSVGAVPEMLDGCGAKLIEAKNVVSLKDALKLMISDDSLRLKVGALARERVLRNYSIEAVFPKYLNCWREAVSCEDSNI